MKFSTKARYGLRAVIEIAKSYGSDIPAKRKDIAANQGISDSYLENILIVLKNAGIIETTRGANGGYILCRDPAQISVLEIVTTLEGPLDLVDCVSKPSACMKSSSCSAHCLWKEISDNLKSMLEKKSLKDMLDKESSFSGLNYSI